jgi:hypothetical protein
MPQRMGRKKIAPFLKKRGRFKSPWVRVFEALAAQAQCESRQRCIRKVDAPQECAA